MGDRVPFYGMLKMFAAAVGLASGLTPAQSAPFMIVGNDEKLLWDDQFKPLLSPSGRDSMLIVDLADPMNPKIVANLPLKNSVVGPPVNLDIDPSGSIALIADSINVIKDGENVKQVPDDKVHVIDLKANPPKAIGTITSHMLPVPTLLAFPAYFRTQSPTTPVAVPHLAPAVP